MSDLRLSYNRQKASAKQRVIDFNLTFDEWLCIWTESGKLDSRGKGDGKYVMGRIGDVGPYSVGNVEIITHNKNSKDARKNHPKTTEEIRSKQIGTGRGWHLNKYGRYQVTVSRKYVGTYANEADAVSAYQNSVEEMLVHGCILAKHRAGNKPDTSGPHRGDQE